jgi:hypothetical protein
MLPNNGSRGGPPATSNAHKFLLTMTACVDTKKGGHLSLRSDPKVRLADYEGALRYWLHYPDDRLTKILFIENSGYSLRSLEDIAHKENPLRKNVEFISLDCNWYPPDGHYGYAELRALDLGLQQSELRNQTTHMIKVTGRFQFPNLSKLLNRLPADFDVAADARVRGILRKRDERPFITAQIILFSHSFYERHFQRGYEDLGKDGVTFIEWLFYDKLIPLKGKPGILLRFPCNVDPVGFPAHRVRSYTHPVQRAVYGLRGVARRLFPAWWV